MFKYCLLLAALGLLVLHVIAARANAKLVPIHRAKAFELQKARAAKQRKKKR